MFFNWATISALLGILGWLIAIAMLFIVPVNRKPSSATAWLLLIFLVPYFGLILFLLLGSPKLPKSRRAEQRNMSELISKMVAEAKAQPELAPILDPEIPQRYEPFIKLNTNLTSMPVVGGNAVELLPEYNAVFARIAQDIDSAQRFVHVEYFATSRDDETEAIFAAMDRAASRGVKVRVLMDHLGSRKYPSFKEMQERLSAAGIEHYISLPTHFFGEKYTRIDLRNHRKIVVIDGHIGYTGSQNLIIDAAGNLFGTTFGGGTSFHGVVYELAAGSDTRDTGLGHSPSDLRTFAPANLQPFRPGPARRRRSPPAVARPSARAGAPRG